MSTHLTRIEREAKEYAALFKYGSDYKQPAYLDGANAELNRAAPLVKALEEIVVFAKKLQNVVLTLYPELNTPDNELAKQICQMEQIIETYKADV